MAVLPGLTLLLGLTDLLSLDLGVQIPRVEFAQTTRDAGIEDFPFLVSLRVNDEHRCGGSIISDNKILTAAHCVNNVPVDQISIRVGSAIHFEGESFAIRSVEIHPTYNQTNLDCDVAFLTLTGNLTFGPLVKQIELADKRPLEGALADVIGWGVLTAGSEAPSDVLKVATVRLINQNSCRTWYPNDVLTNRMLCGSHEEFGRDPCQGDSGGPLVDKATGMQVGVVSWGAGCSRPAWPTVYASVAEVIHSKDV